MKRKAMISTVIVLLVALGLGTTLAAAAPSRDDDHRLVIRTLEVNKVDTSIDVAPSGFSTGDEEVIRAGLVDPQTSKHLGFVQGFCVVITTEPISLECYGTMHLHGGVINVAGSFFGEGRNTWGVTGGTGQFQTVQGYMTLPPAPNGNLFHNLFLIMGEDD